MQERITVYFDYTCPYSYRALRWLHRVRETGRELSVTWKTFSLKEVNRGPEEDSFLAGTSVESVSILALMLAKAAEAAGTDVFEHYHELVFEAMQGQHRRPDRTDLLRVAGDAGVNLERFETDGVQRKWLPPARRMR